MTSIFTTIKAHLSALLIGAGALALALIKWFSFQAKTQRKRAEQAEKTLKYRERVDEADNEIEQTYSRRAEEAKRDIKDGKVPEHLRNPR